MTDAPPDDDAIDVTEDVPDNVFFLDSGRVRFVMLGRTWTLRRPTLGEVKALRRRLSETAENNTADFVSRAEADNPYTAVELFDRDQEQMIGWLSAAFTTLGDKRLPTKAKEVDDLPPWFTSPQIPAKMIAHWQTVPLASGAASAAQK